MQKTTLSNRLARPDDLEALRTLMNLAIGKLQKGYLGAAQIESSRLIMGLDTQLIGVGTHFVTACDWSTPAVLAISSG